MVKCLLPTSLVFLIEKICQKSFGHAVPEPRNFIVLSFPSSPHIIIVTPPENQHNHLRARICNCTLFNFENKLYIFEYSIYSYEDLVSINIILY